MATKPTTDDAYAEGTYLVDVLGDPSKVKILATMLGDHKQDLTASDISRISGIDRTTFYEHIDALLDYGLLKITREAGNSKLYQINKDSEPAKALAKFEWDLLDTLDEDGKPDARIDERDK